jgi:hypothetical protein
MEDQNKVIIQQPVEVEEDEHMNSLIAANRKFR